MLNGSAMAMHCREIFSQLTVELADSILCVAVILVVNESESGGIAGDPDLNKGRFRNVSTIFRRNC